MTQPIQEPTLARTDSRLTWGQNQLFRRPAPESSGFTPLVYRAQMWQNVQSITNNAWTILLFDEYSNPDLTYFDEDTVGDDLTGVILFIGGLVTINFAWQWVGSWTCTEQGGAIDDDVNVWQEVTSVMPRNNTSFDYTMSMTKSYPAFEFDAGHGGNSQPRFDFSILQNSGVSRSVQARFEVIYWGPFTAGAVIET